jgi:1-acyl-sn-glycerol-3-phosphate acyltransferase
MIRVIAVLLFLSLYVPPATILGHVLARLAGSPAPLYRLGRFGVRVGLLLSGTDVVVEGREHLQDPSNTVVMPNHVSHLDAPVLFQALGIDLKVVAKKGIFRIPFLRTALRLAGFIPVDRADRAQAREAISRAAECLKAGACFLIFPEGTRSHTGELGQFRKGGFVAALEAGSRIVPVALRGTRERMPRGGLRVRPGRVHVRVLDPVEAGSYSYDDRDQLVAAVRGRIAAALSG